MSLLRHPPPGVPLESRSNGALEEMQASGVTGPALLQDAPIYPGPFAFTSSDLASLLDLKDLATLEGIGGIESLLRGLGTHPTHGLLTGPGKGRDHASEGRPSAGNRCNPYHATLQERKRVFGENILLQYANKSWLISMCCRLLYKALIIAMVISLALIPLHNFGMLGTSKVFPVVWVGGIAITIFIVTVVIFLLQYRWTKNQVVGFVNDRQKNQFGPLKVKVVRDGVDQIIDAKEVVVGDIALLEPGEIIPCDGIFLDGANVKCDESATTGQVDVVNKATFSQCVARKQPPLQHVADGEVDGSAAGGAGADRRDCFIVSGSKVLEGSGCYVVVAVGTNILNIRMTATYGEPGHVLSNKTFKPFFTSLRQPEVLPSIRSSTEQNSSMRLNYDNFATSSTLQGDLPRSSSFIDTDLARIPEDHTPTLPVATMATPLACHTSFPRIHMSNSGPPPDVPLGSSARSQNHLEGLSNDHSPFDTLMLRDLAKRASRYCTDLGDRVDRDITKVVRGGSAFVCCGTLHPEGITVAVKTFHFGHKSDSLLHEVHIWSKLSHRNVLPLLGITTKFDRTVSIVSAWMTLGNAHKYVQNIEVDPRPLLVGIATGLQYLHSHKPNPIYHGDLKGLNVLISNDGRPLLVDFGFSFIVNSSDVEGGRGGTPHWMAPEQFDSDECTALATAQADVWAFGMTALELFTRHRPFPEIDALSHLIIRILEGPPDRPFDETTCLRLTDEWWNICLSCWHSNPLTRPCISDIVAKFPIDSPDE